MGRIILMLVFSCGLAYADMNEQEQADSPLSVCFNSSAGAELIACLKELPSEAVLEQELQEAVSGLSAEQKKELLAQFFIQKSTADAAEEIPAESKSMETKERQEE